MHGFALVSKKTAVTSPIILSGNMIMFLKMLPSKIHIDISVAYTVGKPWKGKVYNDIKCAILWHKTPR